MMRHCFSLGALLALSGCAVLEPHYSRPPLPTPGAWPQGSAYDAATEAPPSFTLPAWRDFFSDDKLRAVIAAALANNRDLRVAALNIEAARARYHVQRAQSLPTLDA